MTLEIELGITGAAGLAGGWFGKMVAKPLGWAVGKTMKLASPFVNKSVKQAGKRVLVVGLFEGLFDGLVEGLVEGLSVGTGTHSALIGSSHALPGGSIFPTVSKNLDV